MIKEVWVPERGEIIWIDYNPQSGREMRDMHPMLVLSPKKFNNRTGIVIGLPMTTAEYNDNNPFAIKFQNSRGAVSYVLTHQPKSFDWRKRSAKIHPWKKIPEEVFADACERLNKIIMLSE
ncbi:MAG: type II toxin-antitoxin system PemK/MazF family toxin [Gammaproteobacteria bacterium]|nr:MAG: type II toxin-antitoxin system PemK/MazF family toxin [Gammaproteobacteria bacterium]